MVVGTLKEVDSSSDAGVVWVILGTSTGLLEFERPDDPPRRGDLPNTPFATGWFGYSVAAGRFWGGSYDGVAIGEPGRSYLGHPDSGRVVLGKGSLLGLSFTSPYAITLFQNDAGWNIGDNDLFGRALAAGYYDTNDGYEDLAVGSPGDNANGGATNAGVVSILFGGANGPGAHGWVGWAEDAWADPIEINDTFATSLAIGRFEDGGKGSLAIGAPGEDTGTGAVFIAAPWRQRQYPNYKTGLSADCEGNWVYALRPFDEVCIASTTKIMTVLIACERTQLPSNDPKFVSINASYTVPDWIRQHIGGSLYGFRDEQTLTLGDLLRCCLYPSGNDAAFAIADLLTGSNNSWGGAYDNSVQTFVDEMNDRASAIGMNDTYFTNPAGLDTGSPHSTAADMVKLAAVAMQNSRFRGVCSNTSYTFTSTYLSSSNLRVSFVDVLNYGFLQGLQNYDPSFNGLKPGWTPCAAVTGVYSTDNGDLGYALAATFGTPHTDGYRERYRADADAIMDIAQSHCGSALADGSDQQRGSGPLTQGGAADGFHVEFGAMSTQTGKYSGGAAEVWSFQSTRQQYLALDLTRPGGAGTTRCDLTLSRSGELDLAPGAQAELGIGPFESHGEIVLTNQGDTSVTVLFSATQIGPPIQFNIPAGGRAVVPAYSGPRVSSWTYSIQNPSTSTSVAIGLSESFSFALTGLAGGSTPVFSALLLEDDELVEQSVRADVQGTDPLAGRTVSVSLHDTNVLVDVPGSEVIGDAGAVAKLFPATPNPFSATTRLAYELPSAGPVRLDIIDPSGRRVRRFDRADAPAGRGSFEWDGLDEAGRGVAPGVFFYRLERDGREEASGRVIRVR
ncbi:MAG: FlgD immunoglobulin-like domain containing protein [Candidatus Eisenbacteria bacterium]